MPLVGLVTFGVDAPCLGILSEEGSLWEQSTGVFPKGAAVTPPNPLGSLVAGPSFPVLDPW